MFLLLLFIIVGISLRDLVYELSNGMRLSTPNDLPSPISTLLDRCFLENAECRPTFMEIKETITNVFRRFIWNKIQSGSQPLPEGHCSYITEQNYVLRLSGK